jgi:hypothetical protein
MGEMYWIQPIQSGIASGLANYPPNKISGITMIGAIPDAYSALSKMLDMK